jgi:hypothetical protein
LSSGEFAPPEYALPHPLIEPSVLRAAKAFYTKIYSTTNAFAALTRDGSIKAWGGSDGGGENAPFGSGYTKIYSSGKGISI